MFGWLAACNPAPPAVLEPAAGPSSGYHDVTASLEELDPADVIGVTLAGVRALDLRVEGEGLVFTVQGAERPGPARLVLETRAGSVAVDGAYTYEPPVDPLFDRTVVFGASLTQGVQSGAVTYRGGLMSPMAQVARAAGAFLGLPLVVPGLMPELGPEDQGPPPDCFPPDFAAFAVQAGSDLIASLTDPATGLFSFEVGRLDPSVPVRNVAVGGSKVSYVLHGPPPEDIANAWMAHLQYDPRGDAFAPVDAPQIDHVEALAPTLILSPDLLANDFMPTILAEGVDPAAATPEDVLRADLVALLDRLEATGAEVFVGNCPPVTAQHAADAIRARSDDPAAVDLALADIDARVRSANAMLAEEAALRERIHVVDVYTEADRVLREGVVVGDRVLEPVAFGGLLSMDQLHFTDTGYAALANVFLDAIEAELGVHVPRIDLAAVQAEDPLSPDALRALGWDAAACR